MQHPRLPSFFCGLLVASLLVPMETSAASAESGSFLRFVSGQGEEAYAATKISEGVRELYVVTPEGSRLKVTERYLPEQVGFETSLEDVTSGWEASWTVDMPDLPEEFRSGSLAETMRLLTQHGVLQDPATTFRLQFACCHGVRATVERTVGQDSFYENEHGEGTALLAALQEVHLQMDSQLENLELPPSFVEGVSFLDEMVIPRRGFLRGLERNLSALLDATAHVLANVPHELEHYDAGAWEAEAEAAPFGTYEYSSAEWIAETFPSDSDSDSSEGP